MKKILFIESGVYDGGSFMSLAKHIDALDHSKFSPVIVFFNKNKWESLFKNNGYKVYILHDAVFSVNSNKIYTILNALFMKGYIKYGTIPFLKLLHYKAIKQVETIIERHNVDFVHLNTELFRDRIGLIAASNRKTPIICHLRSKYELGKISFSKEYIEFANKHVQKYIAVSKDTADFWVNEVKLVESKFQVLYDYFEPIEVKSIEDIYNYDGLKLVCVANIIPVKGLEFLLQSCAPVLKEFNARLFLLGKGKDYYLEKIKTQIKELAIEDSVCFIGYRNDVPTFLLQSDLVLLFSKREGLPNVIIEAMGTGSLIIATSVGGIPEIINDGVNGFLVPFGNINIASEKIRSVLQMRKADLNLLQENALQTVEGKFSKKQYKSILTKLYE